MIFSRSCSARANSARAWWRRSWQVFFLELGFGDLWRGYFVKSFRFCRTLNLVNNKVAGEDVTCIYVAIHVYRLKWNTG
jgi:hypothetical protein